MRNRICVTAILAITIAGVGMGTARADGPACDEPGYLVCEEHNGGDSNTWLRIGPNDIHASRTDWTYDGDYSYSQSDRDVVVDSTGVTLTDEYYFTTFYDQEERDNTKQIGTDGYHEHEEYTYYGPYGGVFYSTADRSLDANGFEQRTDAGTFDRVYVDTNPDGGVGAGKQFGYGSDCIEETSLTVDPAAADPALLRLECPYSE